MSGTNDIFQKTWEYQKEYVDKWLDSVKDYGEKFSEFNPAKLSNPAKLTDWYEKLVSNAQDMLGEWSKASPWDMVSPNKNIQSDVFNKLMGSTKVYEDLFQFYSRLADKKKMPGIKDVENFMLEQKDIYDKIVGDIFSPLFPQASQIMFSSSNQIIEQLKEISKQYTVPWTKAVNTNSEAIKQMLEGSFEQYQEVYDTIAKLYEQSYGKYFEAMGVPFGKTDNADFAENLGAFKDMYLAQTQLLAYVKDVAQKNMTEVVKKYQEFVKPDGQPKTIDDFIDLFINVNDDVFIDLMRQDEFNDLFANYTKQFAMFKQNTDALLEKNLAWLPFTPASQMNYVYKTLHDLRKQVYYNTKTIAELSEKLALLSKKIK